MSSPEKKRKKRSLKPSPESSPTPSLPNDLVVSCLARVSRLYHPNLSLVSKRFLSILTSPELYKTQTLLGRTETFLYVCLRFPDEANPRWFILYRKPNQTLTTQKDSSRNILAPLPIPNSPPVKWSNLAAIGCNIYAINGLTEDSSSFWFLDCRTHTWLEAPRMRLAYKNFDGVLGVVLKPRDFRWEAIALAMVSCCMIDNIIYSYFSRGVFKWRTCLSKGMFSRNLKGLEGLPKFASDSTVELANYGGKLVVLWDEYVPASEKKEKMIWCAEISLEKRNNEEILGKVEWFDAVLTVPNSYRTVCAVAATV